MRLYMKNAAMTNIAQNLAVSKTKPASAIESAYAEGVRDFGENYLQEALEKINISPHTDITWHFLGPIQSNKTLAIASHFDWVHGLERLKIAKRLNDQRPTHLPPLNVCVQVNLSNESTKSGCKPEETAALCRAVSALPHLCLRGLMVLPKAGDSQAFMQLASLQKTINQEHALKMDTLSMGMSGDLEAAIAAGATHIRVGSALFGPRENLTPE